MPTRAAVRLAELCALTGVAVSAPVLDVTGRSPELYVYRQATAGEVAAAVALVAFGLPLGLWAIELVARRAGPHVERRLHVVLVAALAGLLVLRALRPAFVGRPLVVTAALGGVAFAAALARWPRLREAPLFAAPAPLVVAVLFVTTSPAGALVRPAATARHARAAVADRPPVVVVFFDEFPMRALLDEHSQVDARLFPGFAKLAEGATWYRNATSAIGQTPLAVPSMLTGRYPAKRVAPHFRLLPDNLFTLLGGTYDMRVHESVTQLCPPKTCTGAVAGRETGLRPVLGDTVAIAREVLAPHQAPPHNGEEYAEELAPSMVFRADRDSARAANQISRFGDFMGELRPDEGPTLHFLHVLLPHMPYRFLPSGRHYAEPPHSFPVDWTDPIEHDVRPSSELLAEVYRERLLLQAAYVDRLVGSLTARLRSTGLWDRSMVVITADHGLGTRPNVHSRTLDDTNSADLAWVPLFVKWPGQQQGVVDDRNAQGVDVLPTVADAAGIPVPWRTDGRSLRGEPRGPEKPWYDHPAEQKQLDVARFRPLSLTGLAPARARAGKGARGRYDVGPPIPPVGTPVGDVGPTADWSLRLAPELVGLFADARNAPALLWGSADRPPDGRETWLAAAVNGTFAGAVAVVTAPHSSDWYFMGIVTDEFFQRGANDVRFYQVDGATLRPVELS